MGDSSRAVHIVLIGMRGSGKTIVGRALAHLLDGTFVDTDEQIEARAGMNIAEIFDTEGEVGFRRREREVIAELERERPTVVSAGGGAILDTANVQSLRRLGKLVWLTATADVLWSRIQNDDRSRDTRPPLTVLGGVEEIAHVLRVRESAYREAADLTIDTTDVTPEDVARTLRSCAESTTS